MGLSNTNFWVFNKIFFKHLTFRENLTVVLHLQAWISFVSFLASVIFSQNCINLVSIMIYSKHQASRDSKSTGDAELQRNLSSILYKWIYQIMYTQGWTNTNRKDEYSFWVIKASWFFVLVILSMSNYWLLIKSYQLATEVNINIGVISSMFVLKAIVISGVFWILFGQKLRRIEIVCMIMLWLSVMLILLKIDVTCLFGWESCKLSLLNI